jgi:hypothetical protein
MSHTTASGYELRGAATGAGRTTWVVPRPALTLFTLLALLVLLLAPQRVAFGQDDEGDAPQSPELERLKVIKAEAEARQAIAEARRAELDANFPKPTSTPLAGDVSFKDDNARVEEKLVGYISVAEAANRIANAIHGNYPGLKALAVLNDGDVQLLLVYSAATKRVDAYVGRYGRVTAAMRAALAADPVWAGPTAPCDPKALAAGLGGAAFNPLSAATSVIGSVSDILAFFRTDVSIEGSAITVGEPVIVTETFRALRDSSRYGKSIALYYPREIPPDFDPGHDSPMLTRLEELFNAKAGADDLNAQIAQRVADKNKLIETLTTCRNLAGQEAAKAQKTAQDQRAAADALQEEVSKLKPGAERKAKEAQRDAARRKADAAEREARDQEALRRAHSNDITKLRSEIALLQAAVQPLPALNSQTDLLVKDMVKVNEQANLNPLTSFLRAERIHKVLKDTDGYWLKLNVVNAGGTTKVKRHLFIDVFNGGPRVRYSGASTVEYHLYDRLGRSMLSDTTNSYIRDKKAKDVQTVSSAAIQDTDQK